MQKYFTAGVVFAGALISGTILAVLILKILLVSGQADTLQPEHLYELFSRVVLVTVLAALAVFVFRNLQISKRSCFGLRPEIILAVYGAGVAAALLDPFSSIRSEFNLIRYPTAIVLVAAGVIFVRTALSSPRHVVFRLLGGGLGVVLFAAAADEIMQFHERLETSDENLVNQATGINSQDLATLGVAVAGLLLALIAKIIVRYFGKHGVFGTGAREVLAAHLVLAAGVAFLFAMLLDTFDTSLSRMVYSSLSVFLSEPQDSMGYGQVQGYVETLANSLEEFLEYGTAVLLLASAVVFRFETN